MAFRVCRTAEPQQTLMGSDLRTAETNNHNADRQSSSVFPLKPTLAVQWTQPEKSVKKPVKVSTDTEKRNDIIKKNNHKNVFFRITMIQSIT